MTLTSQEASRAFTCSSSVGCGVGAIMGVVTMMIRGDGNVLVVLRDVGLLAVALGGLLGCLLGLLIGAPIALVIGVLRPVLPQWRAVGAGLAGIVSGTVVASVTGIAGLDALLPVVTGGVAAAGAWIGLGRIYGSTS